MSSPSYKVLLFSLPPEDVDVFTGRLYDLGCLGLEEQEEGEYVVLKAYFNEGVEESHFQDMLTSSHAHLVRSTTIGLGDWTFRPASFEPFVLEKFEILPPPDLVTEVDAVSATIPNLAKIFIRPGPAFGTGRHTTTRLVARAFFENYNATHHRKLLDMGTGSGILALLARKAGMRDITAVDISPESILNAQENFALNHASDIRLTSNLGSIPGAFDIILGNLLTPTLLHLRDTLLARLAPGGLLIVSGITNEEAATILAAYEALHLRHTITDDDWTCFVLENKPLPH